MLAYHWRAALELVQASGGDIGELAERSRFALGHAGDRAFALNNYAAAAALFEDALALWPEDDAERPNLLFRWARALYVAYDDEREVALEAARDALVAAGDDERPRPKQSRFCRCTSGIAGKVSSLAPI